MSQKEIIYNLSQNEELKKDLLQEIFSQKASNNKKNLLKAFGRGIVANAFNYAGVILSVTSLYNAIITQKNVEITILMSGLVCGLSTLVSVMITALLYGRSPGFNFLKESFLFSGVKKDFIKLKYEKPISLAGLNILKKYLSFDEMKILLADKDNKLTYNSFNLQDFQQEQKERVKIEQFKKKSDALVDNMYKNNV